MCNQRVKARRHYNEGEHQDDEIEGKRTWNLEKKINDEKFTSKWVKVMNGEDFTMKFLQEGGFDTPMLFKSTEGLGIKVPGKDFTVNDVKLHVGSRRQVDVMDVHTQKGVEMSMAQFAKYYENKEREQLYNVISLEFSRTKLEEFVEAPSIVRHIDWVDIVWPQHLKKDQRDSTNTLAEMKYPKVQKYCLMSVAGCYTDFHIDFGGTSVWYHILHGKKVFWLIPPSEDNLELYENWVLSGKQSDIFLGDRVRECTKIVLEAGYTFMIPSGWIHAVYTPQDSLVFGGNILHSFHIHRQLRVAQIEDRTHVPFKFRYPFFWEMNWYALERYVHTLTGKSYLAKPKAEPSVGPPAPENSDEGTNDSLDVEREVKTEDAGEEMEVEKKFHIKKEQSDDDAYSEAVVKDETASLTGDIGDVASPADTDKTEEMDLEKFDRTEISADDQIGGSDGMLPNGDHHASSPSKSPPRNDTSDMHSVKIKSEPLDENQSDADGSEHSLKPVVKQEQEEFKVEPNQEEGTSTEIQRRSHVNLCRHELIGLRVLHHQLENLPLGKRSVPELITDPDGLLQHAKDMLAEHLEDSQVMAVTGIPVLKCLKSTDPKIHKTPRHKLSLAMRPVSKRLSNGIRRRRTRCRKCENCLSDDCRDCHFCKDMKKYGGPGRMKQSCVARQCLYPMLPHNAVCAICTREDRPGSSGVKGDSEVSSLMECHQCFEIVHPECQAKELAPEYEGVINEDLANSWQCPKCVAKKETQGEDCEESNQNEKPTKRKKEECSAEDKPLDRPKRGRPPLHRAEVKSSSRLGMSRGIGGYGGTMGFYKPGLGTRQQLLAKQKVRQARIQRMRGKQRRISRDTRESINRNSPSEMPDGEENTPSDEDPRDKQETIYMKKKTPTVFPKFVVRPLPTTRPPQYFVQTDGRDHPLQRDIWLRIFHLLSQSDLCRCLRVCKTWNWWCFESSLWHTINVSKVPLDKYVLAGIVRRQPICLDLSGSGVTKMQLAWLMARLPALKELHLARVDLQAIIALCSATCPQLCLLNLQWVSLQDGHLTTLLSPIRDHHPGLLDDRTKLCKLQELQLAGSDITDMSMEILIEQTPLLARLDLSFCGLMTSQGIATLLAEDSPLVNTLTDLNVSGCHKLSDDCLVSLSRCRKLKKVVACSIPRLAKSQWRDWAVNNRVQLEL
ncbi:lysine-specific demethylase 2B-like isoform X2 [Patiria miniata]|uniref:[histone H3]-dimethyl-L-lysine(36) demethylase n=1 Tax=Patiria miniata TaxID=46514 RepID=A0A913ZQ42_PATMI|nr:lysine-specific demethylase 2B-like isoform X2 [Patiria miniata]XP_038053827.1 lysine-specific demethylase 2B-like isoform X2 [Patiria miniata]